jgi:hypothetical protein
MAFGLPIQFRFFFAAFIVAVFAVPFQLAASPLDKKACEKLVAEKKSLVEQGAEKNKGKGPEWAKAHLKPTQLEQVKRYIAVDEQLKFRCKSTSAKKKHVEKKKQHKKKKAKTNNAKPSNTKKDGAEKNTHGG